MWKENYASRSIQTSTKLLRRHARVLCAWNATAYSLEPRTSTHRMSINVLTSHSETINMFSIQYDVRSCSLIATSNNLLYLSLSLSLSLTSSQHSSYEYINILNWMLWKFVWPNSFTLRKIMIVYIKMKYYTVAWLWFYHFFPTLSQWFNTNSNNQRKYTLCYSVCAFVA